MTSLSEADNVRVEKLRSKYGNSVAEAFRKERLASTPGAASFVERVPISASAPKAPAWVPFLLLSLFSVLARFADSSVKKRSIHFEEEKLSLNFQSFASEKALQQAQDHVARLLTSLSKRSSEDLIGRSEDELRISELRAFISQATVSGGYNIGHTVFTLPAVDLDFQCRDADLPFVTVLIREWRMNSTRFPNLEEFAARGKFDSSVSIPADIISSCYIGLLPTSYRRLDVFRTMRDIPLEALQKVCTFLKDLGHSVPFVYEFSSYPGYVLELLLASGSSVTQSVKDCLAELKRRADHVNLSSLDKEFLKALAQVDYDLCKALEGRYKVATALALPTEVKMMVIDKVLNSSDHVHFFRSVLSGEISPFDLYEAPKSPSKKITWADVISQLPSMKMESAPRVASNEFIIEYQKKFSVPIMPFMETMSSSKPKTTLFLVRSGLLSSGMAGIEKSQGFLDHEDGSLESFWLNVYRFAFVPDMAKFAYLANSLKTDRPLSIARVLRSQDAYVYSMADFEALERDLVSKRSRGADKAPPQPSGNKKGGPKTPEERPDPADTKGDSLTCDGKLFSRRDLSNRLAQAVQAGKDSISLGNNSFKIPFFRRLIQNPATKNLYSNMDSKGLPKPKKSS